MKKLLSIILMLGLLAGFTACSSDDDNGGGEKFVWGGDWNDPADPNYKPGGYNPIQGLWQRNTDKSRGLYFSEDFKCYTVTFYPNGGITKELFRDEYIINDKAYMYPPMEIWRYKLENGKFWNTPERTGDSDWRGFTRVEE